jgi:hypothetical protein
MPIYCQFRDQPQERKSGSFSSASATVNIPASDPHYWARLWTLVAVEASNESGRGDAGIAETQRNVTDSRSFTRRITMAISLPIIENKTILTATGGFLGSGYTHTINLYHGCPFAHALCGAYCYAQHNFFVTKGRPWHFYGVKRNVAHAYRLDYDALKRPRRGVPKPLRIYFSFKHRSLSAPRVTLATCPGAPYRDAGPPTRYPGYSNSFPSSGTGPRANRTALKAV